MKKLFFFLLMIKSHDTMSQQEFDSLEIANIIAFDSLVNSRSDQYFYASFDINYSDTLVLTETILPLKTWSLNQIFLACCDEKNKDVGYKALIAFLQFHESNGKKIYIMDLGYSSKTPSADGIILMEHESGCFYVPTTYTIGCIRSKCTSEIIKFIDNYNKYGLESPQPRKRSRK